MLAADPLRAAERAAGRVRGDVVVTLGPEGAQPSLPTRAAVLARVGDGCPGGRASG